MIRFCVNLPAIIAVRFTQKRIMVRRQQAGGRDLTGGTGPADLSARPARPPGRL